MTWWMLAGKEVLARCRWFCTYVWGAGGWLDWKLVTVTLLYFPKDLRASGQVCYSRSILQSVLIKQHLIGCYIQNLATQQHFTTDMYYKIVWLTASWSRRSGSWKAHHLPLRIAQRCCSFVSRLRLLPFCLSSIRSKKNGEHALHMPVSDYKSSWSGIIKEQLLFSLYCK